MNTDWDVAAYRAFSDLRLRPAQDLLARVFSVPEGPVVDLGCGAGAAGQALRHRFATRPLIGVDHSPQMLSAAMASGHYDYTVLVDIADWQPATAPALIFSNAVLHWLPDHADLVPRLYACLAPGGVLAVQMPGQLTRPSHQTMIAAAADVRSDLFLNWSPFPGALSPRAYGALLPDAELDIWEAEYLQHLLKRPDEAHPVRAFVSSTGARPILAQLTANETARFEAAWDNALADAYPVEPDGSCWFPFRRLFIVAVRPA